MRKISLFIILGFIILQGVKAQSLELQVTGEESDPADADGLITLSWTPTENQWKHTLIKKKPADSSSYIVKDTVYPPDTSYVDTVTFCQRHGKYQITQINLDNTKHPSVEKSILETDPTPEPLVLDSISITENNNIALGWQLSPDYTLEGYIIWIWQDGGLGLHEIKRINNPKQKTGVIDDLYPCDTTHRLLTIAYDGCYTKIGGSPNMDSAYLQSPARIDKINYDVCKQETTIHFDEYNTSEGIFNQKVTEYQLWRSAEGNAPLKRDAQDSVSKFTDNVSPGVDYQYFIRTILTSDSISQASSTSCRRNRQTRTISQPEKGFIESASVESEAIQISGYGDINAEGMEYVLKRSENPSANYMTVDTIPANQEYWTVPDTDADFDNKSYYYQLIALDSCGNERQKSDTARTILLELTTEEENTNQLHWNHYEGWVEVDHYLIYRYKNQEQPERIDYIEGYRNSYRDQGAEELYTGQWHYKVRAVESTGNRFGERASAWSNEVKASQQTRVKMPNAFKPSSTTHYTFKPVATNINPEGYSLKIFNRWGAMIFESNDPNRGWAGWYKNELAPIGTYVYLLQYKNQDGELKQKKGTVTLIR